MPASLRINRKIPITAITGMMTHKAVVEVDQPVVLALTTIVIDIGMREATNINAMTRPTIFLVPAKSFSFPYLL